MSRANPRREWHLAEEIVAFLLSRILGAKVRPTPGSGNRWRRLDLEVIREGEVVLRVEVKSSRSGDPRRVAQRAQKALRRYHPVDAPLAAVWVVITEKGWRVHSASCPGDCAEQEIAILVNSREIILLAGECLKNLEHEGGRHA